MEEESEVKLEDVDNQMEYKVDSELLIKNELTGSDDFLDDYDDEDEEDPEFVITPGKVRAKRSSRKSKSKTKIVESPAIKARKEQIRESKPGVEDGDIDVQCYFCGEMTNLKKILDHMETHCAASKSYPVEKMFGDPMEHQCLECKMVFQDKSTLDNHICDYTCFKEVPSGGESKPQFRCGECDRLFAKPSDLRIHISAAHSDDRPFKCDQCDFAAKINMVLLKHKRRIHDKELKCVCKLCGMKFFDNFMLKRHTEKHHPNGQERTTPTEKCDICGRVCDSLAGLSVHKSFAHGIEKKPVKPKSNKNQTKVRRNEIVNAKCDAGGRECGLIFETAQKMHDHAVNDHQVNNQLECKKCPSHWATEVSLLKHYLESHSIAGHCCDVCGYVAYHKTFLVNHKKSVHQKIKEFSCHICGKAFSQKLSLKHHVIRVHEGGGDLMCDKCEFRAVCKKTLKKHYEVVHLKSNTYYCELCPYKSHCSSAVKTHHRMVHLKVKPHKCEHCDMAYGYSRDLAKHVEKVHSTKTM